LKSLLVILAFLLGCQTQVNDKNGQILSGKVINVIDGDTVTIRDVNYEEHRIRLGEIDSPEKGQEYGKESAAETKKLLINQQVNVFWKKKDNFTWKTTDRQEKRGRIIGGIYIGERFINRELVERGAAWHYKEFSSDETLTQAEASAKKNKYGLWSNPNPIPPWKYRKK